MRNLTGWAKNKYNPEHTCTQYFIEIHIVLVAALGMSYSRLFSTNEFFSSFYHVQY